MCLLPRLPAYLDCFTENFHQGVADLLQGRVTLLLLHCPALVLTLGLQEAGVRHLSLVLDQRASGVSQQGRGDVQLAWLDSWSKPDQMETCGQ